jgi:GTP cyclohydrolase FolE2
MSMSKSKGEGKLLTDTQSQRDGRRVRLQRVGVKGLELPFQIKAMGDGHQTVLASRELT